LNKDADTPYRLCEVKAGEGFTSAVKGPSSGSNFAEFIIGRCLAPTRWLILATVSREGRRKKNRR
jgi:hypothetical protein